MPARSQLAPLLWTLFVLFSLRVAGQALVAFFQVQFLPPMQEWYSGLVPYRYLLPTQVVIATLMARICIDFTRRSGSFFEPRRFFAVHFLYFGYVYLMVMVVRYPVHMYFHPEARWFGGTIPIFFHWLLAAFIIIVGLHHRGRLSV